jgi:NAD(P)-dependent dehydrogenase (short-subunit alcohol dehydrogenase family)
MTLEWGYLCVNKTKTAAIVVGANGGIGYAAVQCFEKDEQIDHVFAISRSLHTGASLNDLNTTWLKSDSSEQSIADICRQIGSSIFSVRYIVVATGILHNSDNGIKPEKRIESLASEALHEVFNINTFLPLQWLKGFTVLLNKNNQTNIGVLSARVGSIEDNRLGGWYSYRASKAALNMLLKTLAVEYQRRFPKTKLTSFHPGTTKTALSRPFQAGVPEHKLFTVEFVAQRLHQLLQVSPPDGELSFQDWDHKKIPW